MKTPRRKGGGVSLGKFYYFKKIPQTPFKRGLKVIPQQRLWGIKNSIKTRSEVCSYFQSGPSRW